MVNDCESIYIKYYKKMKIFELGVPSLVKRENIKFHCEMVEKRQVTTWTSW